ncbi:hypothetical protein ABZS29_14400 [Kribbella sp. NPDC005582]|uniref:LysM peptidoglycan-binding domain-containing protein n=1 Tax=Kribbella sp. NPDC005582 TaxID=3156893 RepID=UPI0033A1D975
MKSLLAVGALVVVGLALRWVTAGTITAANSHDLDSLTVLAVGAVAWIAYCWLVLAVLATALEQLPGAVGTAAGLVARGITSTTSRTLLRSALGVAAVTPLTVGMAQAAPSPAAHSAAWQPTEHLGANPLTAASRTNFRATEPQSSVEIDANRAHSRGAGSSAQAASNFRATEPRSSVEIDADGTNFRPAEPRSGVQLGGTGDAGRTAGPRNGVRTGTGVPTVRPQARPQNPTASDGRAARPQQPGVTGAPAGGGVKVPDRPEVGAATRYTHLRSGVASRVTVAPGDSLWELAKRELGAEATDEQIAARWPEWYAANRQVIGTDPNLILPGQVLRVPPTSKEQ